LLFIWYWRNRATPQELGCIIACSPGEEVRVGSFGGAFSEAGARRFTRHGAEGFVDFSAANGSLVYGATNRSTRIRRVELVIGAS
jgi:hypothetical protein